MPDAKDARDLILVTIKEMQNEIGYYANFKKHQIYQEVYERIVEKFGDFSEDWKENNTKLMDTNTNL